MCSEMYTVDLWLPIIAIYKHAYPCNYVIRRNVQNMYLFIIFVSRLCKTLRNFKTIQFLWIFFMYILIKLD